MQYIHWRKSLVLIAALCGSLLMNASAQTRESASNMLDHDAKPYYFGLTFGINYSQFKTFPNKYFSENDTIKSILPYWNPGFSVGLMGNLRLNKYIDLRMIPSLIFQEKDLEFTFRNDSVSRKNIESIVVNVPIQFKFKSDRIGNFRFYALAGGFFNFDLNSNARSRRDDEILKVKKLDYGYDLGVGFEFYFSNFIFSPEIKIANGFNNLLYNDGKTLANTMLDKMTSRMVMISIHLEG